MQARSRTRVHALVLATILAALAVVLAGTACDPYAICFEPGEPCPGEYENTCTAAEGAYVCAPSCSPGELPCPFPETGDGVPVCVADPITGRGVCVLTCDESTQCPESMGCLEGFCAGFQT